MQIAPATTAAPVAVTDMGRAEIIATFKRQHAEQTAMLHAMRQGKEKNGYVVRNPDGNVCLRFYESEPGKYSDPMHASADRATVFSRVQDAQFVAGRCYNGSNTRALAVARETAIAESLVGLEHLLSILGEQA